MKRPKTAFFDFACCEGCQLQVANMGDTLLEVMGLIDLVEFREVMSEKWDGDLDIAVIEGSITDLHATERIKAIRKRSKVLIAYEEQL
jgi:sulfhydrogenase subunit delta